ncbi:MAG TPA: methyltransferase domain-containing protein [Longimicrobiaceae bacterium]|nr:methyltransferase domain-containing protein [Longimicrobiaceae bacterium]
MIKRLVRRTLRHLGYDILKVPPARPVRPVTEPPAVAPVWPLPRRARGLADEDVRREFARFPHWHYAYSFEGGLSFRTAHNNPGLDTDDPVRPLQRFRHFMPYLVQAQGGTLKGKRILDIACNSGFWSIQCALLGAEVVGFDARPELIEQANLVKSVTGVDNVEFRVLDFGRMSPETLGGKFDVVLNLGFLYHVPQPLEALERTRAMAREHVLLDTAVHPSGEAAIYLKWEEPFDIRTAAEAGVVALPTRAGVELMLRHLKFSGWTEIPVRTEDLPLDYLANRRTSWLIQV